MDTNPLSKSRSEIDTFRDICYLRFSPWIPNSTSRSRQGMDTFSDV